MWRERRRVLHLLRRLDIDLPAPLTVDALVSALVRARGRRIQLAATSTDVQAPCGLWIATAETDYVLYGADASPVLQIQTILHELMHIGLRHVGAGIVDVGEALPRVGGVAATVMRARAVGAFAVEQEHDAELLATYLGARLTGGGSGVSFDGLGRERAAVMYRIASTLAD
ncbi:hypothetical protein [Micromonospora sp. KC213]|uniref:hypothetical protein n=1 Tax=Micromonospora sp. KC213 TaxID=2530378 RepID=UPI00104B8A7C|nr:hypothetical protein [Micromonospora sp. KC213]TDC42842.1 hypothetical protein E1166_06055 [Micromonospora sp. KC213]